MITLNGFAISNYYNKVKLALLEKGVDFREETVAPSRDVAVLNQSPLGKIPFITTERGALSESQAILEYLEDEYPAKSLYPVEPFARAKCREFVQHLELNVELVARRLYPEAFFGTKVSEETKQEVKIKLKEGLEGLARLARFSPFVCGDSVTAADCAAWPHFIVVGRATRYVYGEDMVAAHLPDVGDYLALLETRPTVHKVAEDRAEALEIFYAGRKP